MGATNEIANAKWGQNAQNLLVDNNGSQMEELQLRAYKITYFFAEENIEFEIPDFQFKEQAIYLLIYWIVLLKKLRTF